tara:strand:- start:14 stop:232 length:219 start_codon:yes stop_codon:yes gene_type:complete
MSDNNPDNYYSSLFVDFKTSTKESVKSMKLILSQLESQIKNDINFENSNELILNLKVNIKKLEDNLASFEEE